MPGLVSESPDLPKQGAAEGIRILSILVRFNVWSPAPLASWKLVVGPIPPEVVEVELLICDSVPVLSTAVRRPERT